MKQPDSLFPPGYEDDEARYKGRDCALLAVADMVHLDAH